MARHRPRIKGEGEIRLVRDVPTNPVCPYQKISTFASIVEASVPIATLSSKYRFHH